MKFRTKICMLPVSAATVFVIGVALSAMLGTRLSSGLTALHEIDDPHRTELMQVERSAEQLEQVVQAAAAEGDVEKLNEVGNIAASGLKAMTAITRLTGHEADGQALQNAYSAYRAAAVTAVQALIAKDATGTDELVARMQSTQATLKKMLAQHKEQARAAVNGRFEQASNDLHNSMLVTLGTGVVVLLVLGLVSWVIVRSVWRELGDEPEHLRDQVRRIAGGELDLQMAVEPGDTRSLNAELTGMVTGLRTMIDDIRNVTDSISTAASEITMGNQDLSSRTEQTASRLQATSSSIEQLTGTVRQTSDSARTANQLASTASGAAERGGNVMGEVVTSMQAIDSASRKIVEIISVIDGIAFQTNILALNAAVEAARAGEQGRGFAVVAAEVRSLAQRSAGAAKEIKTLIGASSEKVESGARLVQEAGDSMQAIVTSVKRVNDIIGEITAAAIEQSTGIGHVNETVNQLDQMTQQNASLVEESAAAAESLREQANSLSHTVARFRV